MVDGEGWNEGDVRKRWRPAEPDHWIGVHSPTHSGGPLEARSGQLLHQGFMYYV